MTLTMYDSTNPNAIPANAEMVAEYVDGLYRQIWVDEGSRFASTPKRRIACVTVTTPSDTADFERYDLQPANAGDWWHNMRALGETNLWAYANRSNRVAVEDAMWAAGVPLDGLSMWIATLDGTQQVAAYRYPVAAVQYTDTGSVDLSIVYQAFSAGSGSLGGNLTQEEHDWLHALVGVFGGVSQNQMAALISVFGGEGPNSMLANFTALNSKLDAIKAEVDALKAASPAAEPAEPKTLSFTIPAQTVTGTLS